VQRTERRDNLRLALAGAVVGALSAVGAHVLGVQQLVRIPGLALYLPAALFGAAVGATRLRPLLWGPAAVVAALCITIAYTPLVSILAAPLIRRDVLPAHVDAIAVLSNGFTSDGLMRSETLDRVLAGLSLAKTGIANAVLISRESATARAVPVSDSADLANVVALTSPSAKIIFVDSVFTTRTEALRVLAIARANRWDTLAVVTSPMHTRRACATFEAVGLHVVCVPAVLRQSGLHAGAAAEDRLRAFRQWLYEVFASASYTSRDWIH